MLEILFCPLWSCILSIKLFSLGFLSGLPNEIPVLSLEKAARAKKNQEDKKKKKCFLLLYGCGNADTILHQGARFDEVMN